MDDKNSGGESSSDYSRMPHDSVSCHITKLGSMNVSSLRWLGWSQFIVVELGG